MNDAPAMRSARPPLRVFYGAAGMSLCGVYERTRTFEASPFIPRMIAFPDSISSIARPARRLFVVGLRRRHVRPICAQAGVAASYEVFDDVAGDGHRAAELRAAAAHAHRPPPIAATGRRPDARREPALAAVNTLADASPAAGRLAQGRPGAGRRSPRSTPRVTSYAILEATINDRGLAVAAWYVRDAIETSAYYASHSIVKWTSKERRAFAAAHAAAEDAALSILSQAYLQRRGCRGALRPVLRPSQPSDGVKESPFKLAGPSLSAGLVSVAPRHRHRGDDHQ